jgi:uncharacterized protein YcgI (DUF1989 family)
MNYHHDCPHGGWVLEDGASKPGDYVEFEVLMDCLVALSNCPFTGARRCKVEIFEGEFG